MKQYKGDCSDIVEKTKVILNDKDMAKELINNGHRETKEKHTYFQKKGFIHFYSIFAENYNGKW